MASMKDFLTMYYNRLIFSEMPYEQFVQFCGYIKDKKATDNQKIWAEELLKKDPATGEFITRPRTSIYLPKELPDPADPTEGLSDDEWEKLFRAFQQAFQSMDGAKKVFKYNDKAKKFFESYFGTNPDTGNKNLFQHEKIKATVESRLYKAPTPPATTTVPGTLYYFLEKYEHLLKSRLQGGYYSILTDDFSYDDLKKGLKEGKYNTSAKFRAKLEAVAGYIEGYKSDLVQIGIPTSRIPDLHDYQNWYDNRIDPFRLQQFKNEYSVLLNTLQKESKIREVFEQHDNGKISGPLNKAIKSQSYDDPQSEDYVQPKREDSLTMPERLAEWWSDTYSDCFAKYEKLRGDRLFFSPQAKAIAKHLTKGFNKTDGIDGALKNIGTAKEKLTAARDFTSVKHLKWFESTMNALKNDPKLSKVWAGALKNGTHMQALVKEIIIRAVNEGKKAEAETALELISVMHYDYTTSKIMDALSKENLSIFSDGKLSWNKNEGVQFVTNALDKSIKFALMGIGYGITMAGNAFKMSGRKIKSYTDNTEAQNFKNAHEDYLRGQEREKINLNNLLTNERAQRTNTQTTVDGILAGRTYDVAKSDIETAITPLQSASEASAADLQIKKEDLIEALYDPMTGNPVVPNNDINAINDFLNSLEGARYDATSASFINMPTAPTLSTAIPGALRTTLTTKIADLITSKQNALRDASNLEIKQNELDNLVNGTELLNQLNEQIPRHEAEVANWDANHFDEMEQLALYWNRLETGRNTKTGPMYNWVRHLSAKSAQKDLDKRRNAIILDYNKSHSIAA